MPIVWWLDKQIMIYPYNGISLGYEKNWSTDPCYNLEEPENKWKKPGTKDQIVHLYEVSRIGKSMEKESGLEVARGLGEENSEEWLLNRYWVPFQDMIMFCNWTERRVSQHCKCATLSTY